MLSKLAYLMLCRSIQLLVVLARGDACGCQLFGPRALLRCPDPGRAEAVASSGDQITRPVRRPPRLLAGSLAPRPPVRSYPQGRPRDRALFTSTDRGQEHAMEDFQSRGAPLEYWFFKFNSGPLALLVDFIIRRRQHRERCD